MYRQSILILLDVFRIKKYTCYFQQDDVCLFFIVSHDNFDDDIMAIRYVLEIFLRANLKVKPNKTEIGFTEIQFLRHLVGNGKLKL